MQIHMYINLHLIIIINPEHNKFNLNICRYSSFHIKRIEHKCNWKVPSNSPYVQSVILYSYVCVWVDLSHAQPKFDKP